MTPREHKTLVFIHNFINSHGFSPTYEEIAKGQNLSSKGAMEYVIRNLHDAELIDRRPARARSIMLTDKGEKFAKISQ
tara:strand:- start:465 stop:698 length:234 start_codon:yes stop_codon:yes gene_type:complete